jgi:hypothetical protein
MFRPLLLGHHQACKEYKHYLIELCHNFNMDPYYVLTSFLHNFRINSQAVKAKINIKY